MEEGHKMRVNKKDGITVKKGSRVIKFDIRAEIPKGILWCAYIKCLKPDEEIAVEMSDNQPKESVKELMLAIKMNIEQAHAILGHSSKDTRRPTTAALNMLITSGTLKTYKSCAILKAKQKNLNQESEGVKSDKFNGQLYHDIATVKEEDEDKKTRSKNSVAHYGRRDC